MWRCPVTGRNRRRFQAEPGSGRGLTFLPLRRGGPEQSTQEAGAKSSRRAAWCVPEHTCPTQTLASATHSVAHSLLVNYTAGHVAASSVSPPSSAEPLSSLNKQPQGAEL